MTKDEIIRMADEACGGKPPDGFGVMFDHDQLERFAALVEAHLREKVISWQINSGYSAGRGDTIEDLLVDLEWQVRESERVSCAVVVLGGLGACPDINDDWDAACIDRAEAIRARGQA